MIQISVLEKRGNLNMKTVCDCEKKMRMKNGQCVVMKRRCICWIEPVPKKCKARCQCRTSGMELQLITPTDSHLPSGEAIIFDEILFKNNCDMCCQQHTGIIEIYQCGTYAIDWNVAIKNTPHTDFARFAIEIDNEPVNAAVLPMKKGQLVGATMVHVTKVPTTIRLVNDTGESVELSPHSPIANLRITTVD